MSRTRTGARQFGGLGLSVVPILALTGAAFGDTRTYDGSDNNGLNPTWGAANTNLQRMTSDAYVDGLSGMARSWVQGPRSISNALNAQTASFTNNRGLSDMVWQWGQFLDHDFDLTPAGGVESAPIPTNPGDPHFLGSPIAFTRSVFDPSTGGATARQQPNMLTAYLDGSMIYGSDQAKADGLRTNAGGRLRTSAHVTGDLLPFNTTGLPNDNGPFGAPSATMFVAGDIRANEQSGLTAMHTLWVREHNRIADAYALANPGAPDEEVYQAARRVVGAEIQAITYNEWLPTLLGADAVSDYQGYNPSVDASVSNEFSAAAFRIGHTMLSGTLRRMDNDGNTILQGDLQLRDAFFNPNLILNEGGIEPLLKGLSAQLAQEIDTKIVDDVRNFLFGPPGAGGMDLAAINVQRGRDHGLSDYNTMRTEFGLGAVTAFDQINPDPNVWLSLASVYDNVNEIDPWIGMLAETHLPGSSVGALMSAVILDQFERARDGDRFFYLNDQDLPSVLAILGMDLSDLGAVSLGDIIRLNTGITNLQSNVFLVPSPGASALALCALACLAGRRRRR